MNDDANEFEIRPTADRLPGLLFVPVEEGEVVKNRLHLDVRPGDQAEVQHLVGLGASPVDVGRRVLRSRRAAS